MKVLVRLFPGESKREAIKRTFYADRVYYFGRYLAIEKGGIIFNGLRPAPKSEEFELFVFPAI